MTGFKSGDKTNIVTVKMAGSGSTENLTDRNLFTPVKVYQENINRKNLKPVDQLEGQKKSLGLEYQREYNNLDKTLRENIEKLQDPNITELQKSRLEQSNQRTKELKRDVE